MDALWQDLRYASRTLLRSPGFTLVAVLSLSLGIGATTTAFGVLNAALLRPLPVAQPTRLVLLTAERRGARYVLFNPVFEELRRRQRTLSGMFAIHDEPFLKVAFAGDAAPVYVRGSLVSGGYFPALGLAPSLGRLLTEADDEVPVGGRDCAAVISHRFWVRRFQQDPAVLGRTLRAREVACTLVGVAPAGFESHQAGYSTDVWLPLRAATDPKLLASHGMAFFSGVMGRLRPGVAAGQAEAELTLLYRQIQAGEPAPPPGSGQAPVLPGDLRVRVASAAQGLDAIRREYAEPLRIVMAVVGLVLLIATFNVANLTLARGTTRTPELATRAALGAGRGRLVRQLATEGSLLAALGGLLGVAFASLGMPALTSLLSLGYTTISLDTSPDARVMAVAVAATTLAAVLSGILPAVRLGRATVPADMAPTRPVIGARHGRRLARVLVGAQLSLSLLLVTAAGLLLRTMVRIAAVDPGFRPDRVVVLDVRDESPSASFGTVDPPERKARRAALYRTLDERLNALPGVQAAALSWLGLFGGSNLWLPLIDADRPDDRALGRVDYVSARYFDTVGMQILRGRGFTGHDREGTERVAVVNEALARARFGGTDAVGRRLALDYDGERDRPFTVVGVVRDSKYNDLREDRVEPMMWTPLAQAPYRITSVELRLAPGAPAAIAPRAEATLASADAQLMVRKVTTLSAQVQEKTARERLLLGFASGFGGFALLLAAVGLYGTLAYAVTRRTREIGVRLALGARPTTVLRMVLGEAWVLVAGSLVVGVPLALAAGHALRSFLFGVESRDLETLTGACAVLALAATLAAYVPARRAARLDPMAALREE